MLGLIRGRSAGESMLPPLLILPRFLALRMLLDSFRSLSDPSGVDAVMGDPTTDGLGATNLADEGVLRGPNLGVFRADRRAVPSAGVEEVIMRESEGLRTLSSAAAGNWSSSRSISCRSWVDLESDVPEPPRGIDNNDLGVAALPKGPLDWLCCCPRIAGE